MLSAILFKTVVVPASLGLLLATLTLLFRDRKDLVVGIALPLFAAVAYVLLEGVPKFPPVSAKQKLPMILVMIAGIFAATGGWQERLGTRATAGIIAGLSLAGTVWLGQNLLFSAPLKVALAVLVAAVILASIFAVSAARGKSGEIARIAFPPAAFAGAFAFALAAAFGAFLGMAQANGAMAALLGLFSLVLLLAYGRGTRGAFDFGLRTNLVVGSVVIQFVSATILFTPKLSILSVLVATGSWLMPLLAARLSERLMRLAPLLRAIVAGFLAFLPCAAAVGIAALSLIH